MKIRRWPVLLAVLFLLAVLTGCFLWHAVRDPFAGQWIGIVKVPLMGRSVVQADIRPVEGKKGRYDVAMTAEQYVPTEADPHIYQWQRGASLEGRDGAASGYGPGKGGPEAGTGGNHPEGTSRRGFPGCAVRAMTKWDKVW